MRLLAEWLGHFGDGPCKALSTRPSTGWPMAPEVRAVALNARASF